MITKKISLVINRFNKAESSLQESNIRPSYLFKFLKYGHNLNKKNTQQTLSLSNHRLVEGKDYRN